MPKITFVKEKREIEVPEGTVLRDAALKADPPIQVNFFPVEIRGGLLGRYLNCLGHGTCGSCKVLVKKGMENLAPKGMSEAEAKQYCENVAKGLDQSGRKGLLERFTLGHMLSSIGHEGEMRLACQVRVCGDVTVETQPEFNWSGDNFWQKPYPNK